MRLFCYDLEEDSAIFDVPIYAPYGGIRVSPDGQEVYFTDPGALPDFDGPPYIFIYDAYEGTLLDEISLADLDTSHAAPRPLFAYDIRFHPAKPKTYVLCGSNKGMGPILVIDTNEREITKWFFPKLDHRPRSIDIGPKRYLRRSQ